MTLHRIVAAFGGDLYQGGLRANIPAPGHSNQDRSVSLLLDEGRIVVHGFGGADWQSIKDLLRSQGFIDRDGRLTGGGRGRPAVSKPDASVRRDTAVRLWLGGHAITAGCASGRYLRSRAIAFGAEALNLLHHPGAPTSVYSPGRWKRSALMARISDDADDLVGVELTYLEPNGRLATGLRLPRKTVGHVPAGAAVRLSPAAPEMLVGEGVATTQSAMERFALPGWALRSAHNLAAWVPPVEVRRVLIAADDGTVGLTAAARLEARLTRAGLIAAVHAPDRPFGDWNELAMAVERSRRDNATR